MTVRHSSFLFLNKIQTHKRLKKNAIYNDKMQQANFGGKPFFQATKQCLNNS